MPEISLTDFVHFVTRTGTSRLSLVRQVRRRGDYDPIRDFWKELREGVVRFHRDGDLDLDGLVAGQPEARRAHYAEALKGYRRFLGRKSAVWFEPPRVVWSRGGLDIRVNPELGLTLNGEPHVIKINFRTRGLNKRQIECVLLLMEDALRPHSLPHTRFSVLDASSGKLFTSEDPRRGLTPYLCGEAVAFSTMWQELDRAERVRAHLTWAEQHPGVLTVPGAVALGV